MKQATHDALTGLFNRRHVEDLLRAEVERAQRHARPLAVAMLDADHFKLINDTYGHPTGDDVLRVISERCRTTLRTNDILARYGGEEFVIVFPETNLEEAGAVAERLRAAIAANPIKVGDHALPVTVSIGVAAFAPGNDVERLIERADAALYMAKQDGRNLVRSLRARALGTPPMDVAIPAAAQPAPGRQTVRGARRGRGLAGRRAVAGLRRREVGDRTAHARGHRRRRRARLRGRPHPAHARAAPHLALRAARRRPLDARADGAARRAAMAYYDRKLALDGAAFRRSQALLQKALAGGKALTREELRRTPGAAGIEASGQRLGHIMMRAELDAVVTSGPRRGKQSTYALLDERAPGGRTLAREEALAELAGRYFASHGPALPRGLRLVVGPDGG